jgi:hypothetical protein
VVLHLLHCCFEWSVCDGMFRRQAVAMLRRVVQQNSSGSQTARGGGGQCSMLPVWPWVEQVGASTMVEASHHQWRPSECRCGRPLCHATQSQKAISECGDVFAWLFHNWHVLPPRVLHCRRASWGIILRQVLMGVDACSVPVRQAHHGAGWPIRMSLCSDSSPRR